MEEQKKLTVEILYNSNKEAHIFIGGDDSNPSWEEYIDSFKNEYKPHLRLLKEALEKAGHIGITGQQQQELGITFMFSNGEHWSYTWRAWGDLMQAIVNKREGYMRYYM
jgi:hypothetical protein